MPKGLKELLDELQDAFEKYGDIPVFLCVGGDEGPLTMIWGVDDEEGRCAKLIISDYDDSEEA